MRYKNWLYLWILTSIILLTGCGGGSDSNSPVASGGSAALHHLYGRLTLNYTVNGEQLRRTVLYGPEYSYIDPSSQIPVLANQFEADVYQPMVLVCAVFQDGSGYFCAAGDDIRVYDIFAFQMDDDLTLINGVHASCSDFETSDACIDRLINSPDGPVTGFATPYVQGKSPSPVAGVLPKKITGHDQSPLTKVLQHALQVR